MFKPIRLSDYTTCVSVQDPAIDIDASKWEDYGKRASKDPSCWRELLKMKAGQEPTVFEIGVVPPDELTRIIDECGLGRGDQGKVQTEQAAWRCFLSGVRGIKPWQEDVPKVKRSNGIEYVDPAWLAKTFSRGLRSVAVDVGMSIYHWNQLTEDEVKN